MTKHFFSHLVEIQTIELELDNLTMEEHEKEELKNLIHENIYHAVLDAVLSELSEEDKKAFLEHLITSENDKIWNFINAKVEGIEEKIKKAAEDVKEQIKKDVKESA